MFYETEKIRGKKTNSWNNWVPSYTFSKRKIHSVLPPSADLLPWRKSLLKERTLCGTRSRTYWLSAAQHQYTRQGESAAFTVALSCAQGCSPYLFSKAAGAKVQTNPEAGGSKWENSRVFVVRNKYFTWEHLYTLSNRWGWWTGEGWACVAQVSLKLFHRQTTPPMFL